MSFEGLLTTHVCPLCLISSQVCLTVKCGIGEQFAIDLRIQKPWLLQGNKEIYKTYKYYRNIPSRARHFQIIIGERMNEIFQCFQILKKQERDEYKFLLKYYSILDEFYCDLLDEMIFIAAQYTKPQLKSVSKIKFPKPPKLIDPYLLPIKPKDWNVDNVHNKLKWNFSILKNNEGKEENEKDVILLEDDEEDDDENYVKKYESLLQSNRKVVIQPLKQCDIFSFNRKKRKLSIASSDCSVDDDDLELSKESKFTDIDRDCEMTSDLIYSDNVTEK